MATFAVVDIHGHLAPLEDVLVLVHAEATPEDTVVFLGDYIDRGAKSPQCVEAVLRFGAETAASVVYLCGNHEDWMLRTARDYRHHSWLLGMDALPTIRSYSADAADAIAAAMSAGGLALYEGEYELPYGLFFDALPLDHVAFFRDLKAYHATADCVCAHGGLNPRVERLDQHTQHDVVWGADSFPSAYRGETAVVYGHRNNADLDPDRWPRPRLVGRTFGIDTISHGVLTAIRLPDGRLFQSRRHRSAQRHP